MPLPHPRTHKFRLLRVVVREGAVGTGVAVGDEVAVEVETKTPTLTRTIPVTRRIAKTRVSRPTPTLTPARLKRAQNLIKRVLAIVRMSQIVPALATGRKAVTRPTVVTPLSADGSTSLLRENPERLASLGYMKIQTYY